MYDIEHWINRNGNKEKSPFFNAKEKNTSVCVGSVMFKLYIDGRIEAPHDKRVLKTVDDLTEEELESLNMIVPKN